MAFNKYLTTQGASREEVKAVNDTIHVLIDKTIDKRDEMMFIGSGEGRIKYQDEVELLQQLKKVELKFLELLEQRKVFNSFDPEELKRQELKIKKDKNEARNYGLKMKMQLEQKLHSEKLQKRIDAKQYLVLSKNTRGF